ncbi:MAG: hypothetical protein WDO73_15125 [Ignavibacteriota bacterium]
MTRKRKGPGIPYYEDASEPFRQSLAAFETGDVAALGGTLTAARASDGITLWHLLTRVGEADRGRVFDRFAELVKLPKELRREAIVRRDPHAIDLCWDAFESGEYRLVARLGGTLGRVTRPAAQWKLPSP